MPGKEKTIKTLVLEYFLYNYFSPQQCDDTLFETFDNMTIYDEVGYNITFLYRYLHVEIYELLKAISLFVAEDELDIVEYFAHSTFTIGGATIWFKSVSNGVNLKTILRNAKRFNDKRD